VTGEEIEMKVHVLSLTTSAVILAFGVMAASAQQGPDAEGAGAQQSPPAQQNPGGEMMQQPSQQQTIRERMRERLKARAQLGWQATKKMEHVVEALVEAERKRFAEKSAA
jgi:GDP-D-mannose dehydratase